MQQFLRDTVGPRIVQRSREDMEEALAEIDQLFAAFDAAHSSVRDAEQSTAVMSDLRSGLIVWMEHSSAGSSASRENRLLVAALSYLDIVARMDLAVVCIDQVMPALPFVVLHHDIGVKYCHL